MISRTDAAPEPPAAESLPDHARIESLPLPGGGRLELVALAADEPDVAIESAARAAAWVTHGGDPPAAVPLYGMQVFWTPARAALVGPADRLATVRDAVVEFARSEAALRALEADAEDALADVESDAPLALDAAAPAAAGLDRRFRRAVSIAARIAEVTPAVLRPAPHPPTLAGQVGERLRERTRLAERLEFLTARRDVLDRVYDLCAQRAGDERVARRHLRLEWAIVILLVAELVVLLVDLLVARRG